MVDKVPKEPLLLRHTREKGGGGAFFGADQALL